MKTHACARPGCSKQVPSKYKYCGNACLKASKAPAPASTPQERVSTDRKAIYAQGELLTLKKSYKEALRTIGEQEARFEAISFLRDNVSTFEIQPRLKSGTAEGTVVLVASDWHVEELVGGEIGGLNTYTPEIATVRATKFFQSSLRLIKLLQQDIAVDTVVLALLGDFITGQIHGAENAEKNAMPPVLALVAAQNMLISGIEFLLKDTTFNMVMPCHSGNHARTTKTTRFGSENGHSLEYLLYLHLKTHFRDNPRVRFVIPEGMHSYIDIYGTTVRFHHGHAVKYGGGVGGIYIPVNKAIAQWNKGRVADLDVFGHFHQSRDGGNFICNGSLIGYNSYALSIKADFEQPKQTLFLMDKKRGRTCTWPILVN